MQRVPPTGIRCIALGVLVCVSSHYGLAEAPVFLASLDPPAGFADLAIPQRSLVDIYYGNRYLTAQIATYTPTWIRLSNPAEVIRLISDLKDTAVIEATLAGELQTHSSEVCPPQETEGCGLLQPTVAGVIFDEGRFRLDVFVNRRFLYTRAADVHRYLPPSDAGLSLMQNLNGVWAGSSAEDRGDDYTLSGLSQFAWRENSLHVNWDYSRNLDFQINDLFARRNFAGMEYSAGMIGSSVFGLSFTPDRTLLGARLATSDNTRMDTDYTGGTPLDVFLPTRGRVEIFRDGRLITSWFLDVGNQQLDTSTFPAGAYDIEIVILSESGQVISRETRFFAKQFQLPPEEEWEYFAETGRVLDRNTNDTFPPATDQWLTRAGVSRRLAGTLAGTLAVAADQDDRLLEAGLYHIGYHHEVSPSVMVADNGDHGINLFTRLRLGIISANGSYRRLWRRGVPVSIDEVEQTALLGNGFRQGNLSVSVPFLTGTLSYRYNDNHQSGGATYRSQGLDYRVNLYRAPDYDMDLSLAISRSGDTKIALLGVEFLRRSKRWTWRATPQVGVRDVEGDRDRQDNLLVSASWDDRDLWSSSVRADIGAELGDGDDRYNARLQAYNSWGRGDLSINRVQSDANWTNFYAASLSTSFLTDGATLAVGGEHPADSALVVQVEGRAGDTFDVQVDGQRRGYAVAGRSSVIPLPPFRQYRISLSPGTATLYEFDERERHVTLYPGNVVTLTYAAVPLRLLFGRLMLQGRPLADVPINGGLSPSLTDDLGLFQLESRDDTEALFVEPGNGWRCRLPLSDDKSTGYVLQMGTIHLEDADCAQPLEGHLAVGQNEPPQQ